MTSRGHHGGPAHGQEVFGSCVVSAGIHLGESGGHQKALVPLSCSFVLVALWWIGIRLSWVSLPSGDGGMLNEYVIPANARTKKNPTMISSVVKNRWTNKQVESRCHWPEDYFLLPAAVWSLSAMCHLEVQKKSNLIIHKSLQENLKKNKWKRSGGGQRVDINNQVCQWITSSPQTF